MINIKYFIEQMMSESFWVSSFTLILLISPGILIIFYYFPELFLNIDIIKLLIFVLSIMVPLVTINSFLFGIIVIKNDYVIKSTVLIFMTSLIIYLGLFLSYLFNLTIIEFIYLIVGIEIFLAIIISTKDMEDFLNKNPRSKENLKKQKSLKGFLEVLKKIETKKTNKIIKEIENRK